MTKYLEINNGTFVPLSDIKRLSEITEKERQSLEQLGAHVDASKFNLRLDQKDGRKTYVRESLADLTQQGAKLVKLDAGTYVPKDNVLQVKRINDKDRNNFVEHTGRAMPGKFLTQVQTKAGLILSSYEPQEVMAAMERPISPREKAVPKVENSLAAKRDEVLRQAEPATQSPPRSPQPER